MNMRIFIISFFVLLSFAPMALAQSPGGNVNTSPGGNINPIVNTNPSSGSSVILTNPLKSGTSLESFLNDILAFVIRIGTIVVILMIVYVGYLFVIAQGKPGEIEKARAALLWTVVGALILLGSQAIAISLKATVSAITGP
jgi:hypothetical protein